MASEVQTLRDGVARLTGQLHTLQITYHGLQSKHEDLRASHEKLRVEDGLLRRQNAFSRRQLFGKKSEMLDRNQLDLLLELEEDPFVIESDVEGNEVAAGGGRRRRRRGKRKVRIPEGTPAAAGKKNWLFFGAPDAGERSAIIYTILESCK